MIPFSAPTMPQMVSKKRVGTSLQVNLPVGEYVLCPVVAQVLCDTLLSEMCVCVIVRGVCFCVCVCLYVCVCACVVFVCVRMPPA